MSTSPPYYFRDNNLRSDPRVIAGNNASDGLTDNTAKRTYVEACRIANTAPAGTDIFLCESGGFRQITNFRFTNPNCFTDIIRITRAGNVATAFIRKRSNMSVGQQTTIRNCDQPEYNGLVSVTAVVNNGANSSFSFNVSGNPATPATTSRRMIRFDGAMVTFKQYRSSLFVAGTLGLSPWVSYSDDTNRQHRFDGNASIGGFGWDNINYTYIGAQRGVPSFLFTYGSIKSSFHVRNCVIQNYRTAFDMNTKAANSQNYDAQMHNNLVIDNYGQGWLGSSSNSNISNNTWRNNGHGGANGGNNRSHNFYCSGSRASNIPFDPNFVVRDMVFSNNDVSMAAMNTGRAQGTEIVFHGQLSGIVIEGNNIHNVASAFNGGNYGIDATSGYLTPEKLDAFTIRYNTVTNCGNKAIACSSMLNSTIELNTIVADAPGSNIGIAFIQGRTTPGTVTSNNNKILMNYITGTNLRTDISTAVGTNFTITRTNVPVPPPTGNPPGDTTAPVVTPPVNIQVEATGGLTTVLIGTGTATDDTDGILVPTSNAPASFPLGVTTVTWSATDAAGNVGTATQLVTVVDQTPPIVTAPVDITIQAVDANPVTIADLGVATASDAVDSNLTIINDAPLNYSPGTTTTVTWSTTDSSGNVGADVQNVTIVPVASQPCVVQVKTTTEISVDGVVTSVNTCITNG